MAKKRPDPAKEKKEWMIYILFYFFVASFLVKIALGAISGSRSLSVSAILSLIGLLMTVVTIIRIGSSGATRRFKAYFNRGKLELIVIVGGSVIIVLGASTLCFSVVHMIFFHTLYPPDLFAAWISAVIASLDLCLMIWVKKEIAALSEADERDMTFILNADFIISMVIMGSVLSARSGLQIADYACAIFAAVFFIVYSASLLRTAFAALMDASCDEKTVSYLEGIIKSVISGNDLSSLRASKAGQLFEIMVMIKAAGDMPMRDVRDMACRIRAKIRSDFLMPHEVFVGLESGK